jgi:hypothetical protein
MAYIPELDDPSKFDAYIASIDTRLKDQNIPIAARPLMAPCLITEDHRITITLGDERWQRIEAWYRRRYGERLNIDFSLGTSVVIVSGDAYRVRLPLRYGRVRVNPLEWIGDATAALLRSLPSSELDALANRCIWLFEAFRDIAKLRPESTVDLRTAAEHILRQPPEYGLSKWASLQSTEKALKSFIRSSGGNPPNTHVLEHLVPLHRGFDELFGGRA